MNPQISVIICTHNPRADYLKRVLDALNVQTLPKEQWELLLVDNASKEKLATKLDLSWHPHARHIREDELGLTAARCRGIIESKWDGLVFVDDDNVLAPDYLICASKLLESHTWVGAFGGNIVGEFETEPEGWANIAIPYLAIRVINQEKWALSSDLKLNDYLPCGAGMVIRKGVASYYMKLLAETPLRRGLDRKGTSLISSGDFDMAFCACALGLAVGQFPQLQLRHLIPSGRLKRDYLLRLAENVAFSNTCLRFIWTGKLADQNQKNLCRSDKIYELYKILRSRLRGQTPSFDDEFKAALEQGNGRATEMLRSHRSAPIAIAKSQDHPNNH